MIAIRVLLAAAWLVLAAPAHAGDIARLDQQNGFRDARFGMERDALEGLELLSEVGAAGTTLYVRPSETLDLGEAMLDGVTYGFYRDQLYFVALFSSGKQNNRAVLEAFRSAYGPGARVEGQAEEYVWHGDRVALHFRQDPVTGVGMAAFTSLSMDARVKSAASAVPAEIAP